MTLIETLESNETDEVVMTDCPSLKLESVSYSYPNGFKAVSNVELELKPGILGLLGPNGAGKSTLMHLLATLTKPTQGRILWNGVDIAKEANVLRNVLGYLPQEFGVYSALSAREFLSYIAAIKSLPRELISSRVDQCIELVGLTAVADKQLVTYSGGMRQRVGIAQSLLNDPQVLIVDEPTVGLDPEERLRFRNLLTDLAGQRLVILSSHIVSDVEASATMLAVMNQGRLCFNDSPEAMISMAQGKVWEVTVKSDLLASIRQQYQISASILKPDGVLVRIVSNQKPFEDAKSVMPNMEDAYIFLLAKQTGV